MAALQIFLSVVIVVRNQGENIERTLSESASTISTLVTDYEVIVVDNASDDQSVAILRSLTGEHGLANLQVYALTKPVDTDTAFWVGLENALGDYIAVIDPFTEDVAFLSEMLEKAGTGTDVVFAYNRQKPPQSLAYRCAYAAFNMLYKHLLGIRLATDAPQYRLLSKKVVNFILRHPQPALTYRQLPATGGFSRVNLSYSSRPKIQRTKRLGESIDRGMRLLVSTTSVPMRFVSTLSLFGAVANLLYSGYVVAIGLFRSDVAPGWVSLSLQQSGMFFLISLVLLILGEYILQMARLSNEGPPYHVAQEFTSARMERRARLNIENVITKPPGPADAVAGHPV